MSRDADAIATSVVLLVKAALAPIQERIAVLEARVVAAAPAPAAELDEADIAASVAGLLRKELADLEATRVTKRIVKDDGTSYTVTETRLVPEGSN